MAEARTVRAVMQGKASVKEVEVRSSLTTRKNAVQFVKAGRKPRWKKWFRDSKEFLRELKGLVVEIAAFLLMLIGIGHILVLYAESHGIKLEILGQR